MMARERETKKEGEDDQCNCSVLVRPGSLSEFLEIFKANVPKVRE